LLPAYFRAHYAIAFAHLLFVPVVNPCSSNPHLKTFALNFD
jgi:hypothetical protein